MENSKKQIDVVTIGGASADLIMAVKDVMRFETYSQEVVKKYTAIEYSSKVNVDSLHIVPGGSACNVAADLASIGLKTRYLGVVGMDQNGNISLEDLRSRGVDISFVKRTKEDLTGVSIVLMTGYGKDRSILVYKGAADLADAEYVKEEMIKDAKILVWTSLTSEKSCGAIQKAIEYAKKYDVFVCACPSISIIKKRHEDAIRFVKQSDFACMNSEEIQELTGENTTIKGIKKMLSWGLKKMAVSLGSKGSRLIDGDQVVESGIYKVTVSDTTGAGDAFASGFIYGILNNLSLKKIAKYASALSAFEVEGWGVRIGLPKSIHELEDFINKNTLEQTDFTFKS
ncbi:MAG: carbohydrate kinase family protein [Candidatus Lokiarchaeota archaeon]|nr:carbohydrate kinase family protein [Candidatus Lokiarchaeota archaeon]